MKMLIIIPLVMVSGCDAALVPLAESVGYMIGGAMSPLESAGDGGNAGLGDGGHDRAAGVPPGKLADDAR